MKLVFRGARGVVRADWRDYALLRDNVQHYIEAGVPSERFAALHAIERAVDAQFELVDAARLRGEVMRAWYRLRKLDLGASAVSIRTRAVLTGCLSPPPVRGTLLASRAGWSPSVSGPAQQPIQDVLRRFVAAVLFVTETATDGDTLLVACEGKVRPAQARHNRAS